jgi:hypothetical protein
MKTLLSEQVKVFITDKITIMKGGDVLLNTINNIHSYHKLMNTLKSSEGKAYKVYLEGHKVLESAYKKAFIKELKEFLSN